jgi:hypothetical protein
VNASSPKNASHGSGSSWALGLLILLVIYVLSPPPVVWVLVQSGDGTSEEEWFRWVYTPLIYAHRNFEPVRDFYQAYGELMGLDMGAVRPWLSPAF